LSLTAPHVKKPYGKQLTRRSKELMKNQSSSFPFSTLPASFLEVLRVGPEQVTVRDESGLTVNFTIQDAIKILLDKARKDQAAGEEAPFIPVTKMERAAVAINQVVNEIRDMLQVKNRSYGNAALEPLNVFSCLDPEAQVKVRIDDKLRRLKSITAQEDKGNPYHLEDTEKDLIGYLILLQVIRKLAAQEQSQDGLERVKRELDQENLKLKETIQKRLADKAQKDLERLTAEALERSKVEKLKQDSRFQGGKTKRLEGEAQGLRDELEYLGNLHGWHRGGVVADPLKATTSGNIKLEKKDLPEGATFTVKDKYPEINQYTVDAMNGDLLPRHHDCPSVPWAKAAIDANTGKRVMVCSNPGEPCPFSKRYLQEPELKAALEALQAIQRVFPYLEVKVPIASEKHQEINRACDKVDKILKEAGYAL
jgi:GrpB-like predicted nucleotidyltransferase (UPF0157 family)